MQARVDDARLHSSEPDTDAAHRDQAIRLAGRIPQSPGVAVDVVLIAEV